MNASIEFIRNFSEKRLPIIKLTRSKNGTTGTATFLFIQPFIFKNIQYTFYTIHGMYLVWNKEEIKTNDITIIFRKGKPFMLKAVFVFKKAPEWFKFLNFMKIYTTETGLSFNTSL